MIWAGVETRRRIQADRVNVAPANFYSDISLVPDIKASFEHESGKPVPYLVGGLFEGAVIQDFIGAYAVMAWILVRRSKGDPETPAGSAGEIRPFHTAMQWRAEHIVDRAVPAPGLLSGQS